MKPFRGVRTLLDEFLMIENLRAPKIRPVPKAVIPEAIKQSVKRSAKRAGRKRVVAAVSPTTLPTTSAPSVSIPKIAKPRSPLNTFKMRYPIAGALAGASLGTYQAMNPSRESDGFRRRRSFRDYY